MKVAKKTKYGAVIVACAIFGLITLLVSHASTPVVSIEPEAGALKSPATTRQLTTASSDYAVLFGSSPQPAGLGNADGPSGNWRMVFEDNFDGTALDSSSWNTGWYGTGVTAPVQSQELACFDPSHVTVGSGVMTIKATNDDSTCSKGTNPHPYTSGNVNSNGKKSFSYGYFEAKINIEADANNNMYNWPAWWLDGQPTWPNNGELDIMEGLGGDTASANANWHGPENGGNGNNFADKHLASGWHTFAAEWSPGSVTAYYDGIKQRTYSSVSNITSSPQFMVLGLQIDGIVHGGKTKIPGQIDVDYIRVWQR